MELNTIDQRICVCNFKSAAQYILILRHECSFSYEGAVVACYYLDHAAAIKTKGETVISERFRRI